MTNEEMLAAIQKMFAAEQKSNDEKFELIDKRLESMDQKIDQLQCDVKNIKEDAAITRTATNTLLDWAEKAQVEVKIPLYRKAE